MNKSDAQRYIHSPICMPLYHVYFTYFFVHKFACWKLNIFELCLIKGDLQLQVGPAYIILYKFELNSKVNLCQIVLNIYF